MAQVCSIISFKIIIQNRKIKCLIQGQEDKALKVLQWIWLKNTKTYIDSFPVKALLPEIALVLKNKPKTKKKW